MTMAQKHSESRIITAAVIAAVLVIVLNIVSFAVPLQKQSEEVFYTAYVMSEFVILAEMGIVIAQLAIDAPEHRVLGLPIVWSGFLGAIIQTVATICFYVVNAFYSLPVWVVAVIEALLIGYFIIQITLGFLYKNHAIESSDDKPNTAFMAAIDSGNYDEATSYISENNGYGDSKDLVEMIKAGKSFDTLDYETGIGCIYNIGGSVNVAYDGNGGTPEVGTEVIKKRNAYIGNTSDRDGYTFYGWVLTDYSLKAKEHSASISLKASYETITYTLSFDLDGGSVRSTLPASYTTEDTIAFENPTKTGYTFLGWTGTNITSPTIDYVLQAGAIGNKSYKAKWQANSYTIHLDPAGGKVTPSTVSVTFDSSYSLPTPSYDGHTFQGWYSSTKKVENGIYKTDGDLYLTAHWTAITYNINYVMDGGDNPSSNPRSYTYDDSTFTLKDPTKTGYTFLGWTTDSVTTPTKSLSITTGSFGTINITAHWEANKYTVTVDLNGGAMEQTSFEVTYDSSYSIPSPTRVGYSFAGYVRDGSNFSSSGTWSVDGNVTLEATWLLPR